MPLTIFFVGIFQYLWIYQKPSVLFNPINSHGRHCRGEISPGRGRDCLRETEIGVLEERELEAVVLADRYQRSCGIKALKTNGRINSVNDKLSLYGLHPREGRRQRDK